MSTRRKSNPDMIQKLWDAIKIIIHQRSLPNNDRIVKYIFRVYGISEKLAQDELNNAVDDGLIILKKNPKAVGSVIGTGVGTGVGANIDQESYKLPTDVAQLLNDSNNDDDDKHDWYCYKCQKAGSVECCQSCFRVYHAECHTPNGDNDDKKSICQLCEQIENDNYEDIAALNHILKFACGHMKAKLPPEITNRTIVPDTSNIEKPPGSISGPTWISQGEDAWRPNFLIKNHMDLAIMETKTKRNEYKSLSEFQADAQNILHNIIIYHGANTVIGEMGITMYRDCCYDLKEIRRCADCYRISNEKSEKMWFCIPCHPPHQLVYAKQKGYPYWPAKVMQIKNDIYDVRFFGGHHMRANIEKVFIRPITASLQSLQVKRSTAWNRAFDELKHHQNLLSKLEKKNNKWATNDCDGVKQAKLRKLDTGSKVLLNGISTNKKITKDLRVKVERLTSNGYSEAQHNLVTKREGSNSSSRSTSEERLVISEQDVEEDAPQIEGQGNSNEEQGNSSDKLTRQISSTYPVQPGFKKEGSQEDMVTSSSQEPRTKCVFVQTDPLLTESPAKVKKERRISEQAVNITTTAALEKLRRELELDKCKELERLQAEHAKELRQLTEKHLCGLSEIKKKQWCYNCEAEAIYHCCWNTAYCSTDCQQVHWQREHKRICRRKR